ncbi:hypothetical protein SANA_26020 [Gottschalkiaceae bacterium SANA]|nr:hypothetical protein SANA_26020 [Gottschalkiaceae bacterium SANA]
MEIYIALALLLLGIIILFSRSQKARKKDFIHVSQRIDELERRL